MATRRQLTLTNWGAYEVETDGHDILAVHPFAKDPDPSPIGQSLKAVRRSRVMRPAVRESWYRSGPGSNNDRRGYEPFVEVEWDVALELVASEIDRIRSEYGNQAIFGGSYGWASAGWFHHALNQLHRFLNTIGGYTDHVGDYSIATGHVIVPHVFGFSLYKMFRVQPDFPEIAENSDLVVSFGGMAAKNAQIQYGGQGRHQMRSRLEMCRDRGVRFVNFSPAREDFIEEVDAEWLALRPGTDTAVMLGLIHSLLESGNHDEEFLATYCIGWDRFRSYVLGETDGIPKTPEWAGGISSVDPGRIRAVAAEMAQGRTLITVSWSVQRADHGEQTYWMAAALAAVLGHIGLPGGGVGYGYGSGGQLSSGKGHHPMPSFGRDPNPVSDYIPASRITDLLLSPGEEYDFDGKRLTFPETRMIYWAGGNPFHHHQDLNRLAKAWQKPDTIVCHEPFWNALARYSDVVLPATTTLERNDIGGATADDFVFWMGKVIEPVGEAKNDYEILSGLAELLGAAERFGGGRTADEWVEHLYGRFREANPGYPGVAELQESGFFEVPARLMKPTESDLTAFREDPHSSPLATPSGKIELFSGTIAGFDYADCPGHPAWIEPAEWLGSIDGYPLHLISSQPSTRLHSQWDHGETSLNDKVAGRERIWMNPTDAAARNLAHGDVARVFNDRGACLAVASITESLMEGVVRLPTGAWWDPVEPGGMCRAGNPNVLTRDVGTSSLAQGPSAQTCLVQVEKFLGDAPVVRSHEAPVLLTG